MKNKIGIYAGSFNPFHKGHLDIVNQAKQLFDEVIVAFGYNPTKDANEKEPLPDFDKLGIVDESYFGLLADYLKSVSKRGDGNNDVFLIRGLRNGEDLQHEQNQLQFIREMYPDLKVVFFICDKNLEHVSSSSLRALKKVSHEYYEKYIV